MPTKEVELVNLTKHVVELIDTFHGNKLSLQPTGAVARVSLKRKKINVFVYNNVHIPVYISEWGNIKSLPEAKENTYYIVSSIVADACPGRKDLLVPDNPCYNDATGEIVGMFGLRLNRRV